MNTQHFLCGLIKGKYISLQIQFLGRGIFAQGQLHVKTSTLYFQSYPAPRFMLLFFFLHLTDKRLLSLK